MRTDRFLCRVSLTLAVAAVPLVLATPSPMAATKTTKSSAKSSAKSGAKATAKPAARAAAAPTTTAPPPRSSGTPIKGWDRIDGSDWPQRGDSVIAVSIARGLEVLRAPNDRTGALRLEQGRSMFGPVRLLALGERDGWVRVGVPIRPNGTVGWVKSTDVLLQRNFAHIQIELSTNTMRVYDGDALSIETKVAAGTGGTPTPIGLFFVKELVPQKNPGGALGPFAFGLSGFSTVLNSFANGEGTIGIHGTNAPGKLGGDVSHGCVRVINTSIVSMTKIVPLGTPVEIVQSFADLPQNRNTSDWVDTVGAPVTKAKTPVAAQPIDNVPIVPPDVIASVDATTTTSTTVATSAPSTTTPVIAIPATIPVISIP
jgi:lipoprotein-anchoring transpeptidase ErfK/SrfK